MCCVGSRRDAEAQRFYPCYTCSLRFERCAFAEAVGANSTLRLMCSYVTLCGSMMRCLFLAKAQSSQRLRVSCVYCLWFGALRFRKGRVCKFTLRLLLSFVSFVVNVLWRFLAETQRFCPCCMFPVCFEASLSRRPGVSQAVKP